MVKVLFPAILFVIFGRENSQFSMERRSISYFCRPMREKELERFKELLDAAESVFITMHRNPDGDALGSSLAMAAFLRKKGKQVTVVSPNLFPGFLRWMPGADATLNWEHQNRAAKEALEEAQLIICLDFNDINRLENMAPEIMSSGKKIVVIDHHQDPQEFADLMISDTTSCATAQMVFQLIEALDGTSVIDAEMASCIYAGIMTDTGSFRFSSTTAETHRIAQKLLDTGLKHWEVHERISDQNTEMRMKLMGYTLNEKMRVIPELHTVVISLSRAELDSFHFQKGDTEGFVNLGLSIRGIVLAAFFVESVEGYIKLSLRSKGKFPVNEMVARHFTGGGHINAAGGRSDSDMDQTIEKFLRLLPEYKNELDETAKLI
jgi:phosphoesterase RecJ-like protein